MDTQLTLPLGEARSLLAGRGMVPTFKEFAERWLVDYCSPPFRARYLQRNRGAMVRIYLVPLIGDLRLDQITTRELALAQRELLRRGLALSTVRSIFGVFAEIWKAARGEGLVRGRPQSDVIWPRARRKKPTVFLPEEQDRVLEAFLALKPWYAPQVALCFLAGTRPSEAAGATWDDLDVHTGQLDIVEPLVSGEPTSGKTRKALRSIMLSPRLLKLLVAVRPERPRPGQRMAVTPSGDPVHSERFSPHVFRPMLERIGIPYRSLYAARHTYITLVLMGGASAAEVAEYCGTSIREIEESYLSWIGAVEDPMRQVRRRPARALPALRRQVHYVVG